MLTTLTHNWWMIALRGVSAIVFGVIAIAWPDLTVGVLVAFFGAMALVDGMFAIGSALTAPSKDKLWYILGGLGGIAIGVAAWVWPGLTALTLLYIIASWAVIVGTFEITSAIVLREQLTGELLLALSGLISVVFGLVLFAYPGDGAIALVTTIGFFSILLGGSLIGLAFRVRGFGEGSSLRGAGMGTAGR